MNAPPIWRPNVYRLAINRHIRLRCAPGAGEQIMRMSRFAAAVSGLVVLWLSGLALAARPAPQSQAAASGRTAGQAFKNVTTAGLKDLSVDDFIASMGVISADLGLDCADCHPNAGTDKADFVVDNPRKNTARRMVDMVAAINRTNFSGR